MSEKKFQEIEKRLNYLTQEVVTLRARLEKHERIAGLHKEEV